MSIHHTTLVNKMVDVCLHHWIEVIAASISFIFFAKISNCSTVRLMPANVCKVKEDH
jgi:hypothetical protein